MDEVELDFARWQHFLPGATALMGFIEANDATVPARIDFRTHSGWDGDNIATTATINVWSTEAMEERGLAQWLESLGWEREVSERDGDESWTFLLQLESDPYK